MMMTATLLYKEIRNNITAVQLCGLCEARD
jgi:hypothetical protein